MTSSHQIGIDSSLFCLPAEDRYRRLLDCCGVGLQSSLFAEARGIVREMFQQKYIENQSLAHPHSRIKTSVVIAYTSNLISSGLRETFASMANLKIADAFVSTAGGVEEDVIKCLGDTLVGDFALKGADLRQQGLNRVGNLLIPNDNYINFEAFFVPVVKKLHQVQLNSDWTIGTSPSDLIRLMGEALADPSSDEHLKPAALGENERLAIKEHIRKESTQGADIDALAEVEMNRIGLERTRSQSLVCCCAKNNIPIYCPALTDGSMGDMICFYNFNKKGFVCDPAADYRCLLDIEESNQNIEEHHILVLALGAGLPRNHALHLTPHTGTYVTDHGTTLRIKRTVIQIVTSLDIDGCNSSAQLQDDLQEGLLSENDRVIRVHGDASLLLPMMVGDLIPSL